MNKVYLIGNVTKDLELQHFGTNDRSYVNFTLAVNEYNSTTKENQTNFINVVAFDRKADKVTGRGRNPPCLDKYNTKNA